MAKVPTPEAFNNVEGVAVRAAAGKNRVGVIEACSIDYQRVAVPFSDGVSVISGLLQFVANLYAPIYQLRQRTAIGPNDAPGRAVLVQDRDLVFVLEDLRFPQVIEIHARKAQRLAFVARIVIKLGEILVGPK